MISGTRMLYAAPLYSATIWSAVRGLFFFFFSHFIKSVWNSCLCYIECSLETWQYFFGFAATGFSAIVTTVLFPVFMFLRYVSLERCKRKWSTISFVQSSPRQKSYNIKHWSNTDNSGKKLEDCQRSTKVMHEPYTYWNRKNFIHFKSSFENLHQLDS